MDDQIVRIILIDGGRDFFPSRLTHHRVGSVTVSS